MMRDSRPFISESVESDCIHTGKCAVCVTTITGRSVDEMESFII